MTTVLALGLDPAFVDLPAAPNLTPELVRAFIDAQLDRVRGLGYQVVSCLVDLGATAEAVTETCLRAHDFDCAHGALHYVAPVGEKDEYVARAMRHIAPAFEATAS